MKDFKRLLAYAKPYSRFWPGYLILSILSVIFGVANYALIKPLLDILFNPEQLTQQFVKPDFNLLSIDYYSDIFYYYLTEIMRTGLLRGLFFVCMILLAASFVSNLARYLSQRILVKMRTYIMQNIRRALYEKIISLNVGYFNTRKRVIYFHQYRMMLPRYRMVLQTVFMSCSESRSLSLAFWQGFFICLQNLQ